MMTALAYLLRAIARLPSEFARLLLFVLYLLLWLLWLLLCILLRRNWRVQKPTRQHCTCVDRLPPHIRRRPDPCLYSQSYLMQQGVPVTWDNPDIWLSELDGTPVPSGDLKADHTYRLHSRIWNASFYPGFAVGVRCVYRNWGFSGSSFEPVEVNPNGTEKTVTVDIGPYGNSVAEFQWHTPPEAGHYCIKVQCHHPDDLNSANNVGQENTNVHTAPAGAKVMAKALVFNPARVSARMEMRAAVYEITNREWSLRPRVQTHLLGYDARLVAPEEKETGMAVLRRWVTGRRGVRFQTYAYAGREEVFAAERAAASPLGERWDVRIDGTPIDDGIELAAGEEREVEVAVVVPPTAQSCDRIPVNLTLVDPARGPIGGVTMIINVQ